MSERKFDFESIYFTNELISSLIDEGVLQENNILPEKLRYIVLQLVQNNYERDGTLSLTKSQMIKAMQQANKLSVDFVLDEMVKEGLVEYDGIAPNGAYTIKSTPKGDDIDKESPEGKMIEAMKKLQNSIDEINDPEN